MERPNTGAIRLTSEEGHFISDIIANAHKAKADTCHLLNDEGVERMEWMFRLVDKATRNACATTNARRRGDLTYI